MTSKYASLFVYLTLLRRHGIALNWPDGSVPLTLNKCKTNTHTEKKSKKSTFNRLNFDKNANKVKNPQKKLCKINYFDLPVTVLANVRRIFGGLMSSLRILLSVARGNPLSSISSNNS